jgi:hypothetical protein
MYFHAIRIDLFIGPQQARNDREIIDGAASDSDDLGGLHDDSPRCDPQCCFAAENIPAPSP